MKVQIVFLQLLAVLAWVAPRVEAAPFGPAFTYQGRLADGGLPANGPFDLRFQLFDAAGDGTAVGDVLTQANVAVTDGVFSVVLDFGVGAFDGNARWLRIEVRRAGVGEFVALAPRQPVSPAPYALFAASGNPGPQGAAGPVGPQGAAGPQGPKGDKGDTGPVGAQGPQGSAGAAGPAGPQGATGDAGAAGATGATGPQGPKGDKGDAGAAGLQGAQGAVGPQGAAGSQGPKGDKGDTGSVGAQGPQGSRGPVGAAGAIGPAGPKGDKGDPGNPGATGPAGTQGPQGVAGPQGLPGAADAWSRIGNSGTAANLNFVGTLDDQPLEMRANSARVLRLEPHAISPNIVGGWQGNRVTPGVYGATISGGGSSTDIFTGLGASNVVSDAFGVVGGGGRNQAGDGIGALDSAAYAVVGGGADNSAGGPYSTVGGGWINKAQEQSSTIGGGSFNAASGPYSTIGGGGSNAAEGHGSTIVGGVRNRATGRYSTAAGSQAHVTHDDSFVWSGRSLSERPAPSYRPNQFQIHGFNGLSVDYHTQRADGFGTRWVHVGPQIAGQTIATWTGAWLSDGGAWINASDRNRKQDFTAVNPREVLDKVAALPLQTWRYTNEPPAVRHLGPVAQDFRAAFGLGSDDKSIGTVDADGVALAAIQGLNQKLQEQLERRDAEIAALRESVEELKGLLGRLAQSHGGER